MSFVYLALEFLTSALGKKIAKWGGIGLAVVIALGYARHTGAEGVRAEWRAANAVAAAKVRESDRNITATAEKVDRTNNAAEAATDKVAEESRDAYVAELEKRLSTLAPGDACRGDVDLSRVRNVR